MAEKEALKLDNKDKKLLYLLDVDGRLTYSQLAKKTAMSKQVVKYRMDRLEKAGTIRGYYPMIDTSRLGFTVFRVYFKFKNITPAKKEEIINYFKQQKHIWAVVLIAGKWDIALGVSVENIYQFYEIWDNILEKYLENIKDYKTSIYSPIYHYAKAYITGNKDDSKVRILGGREKVSFDDKDIKILISLSKNARASLLEIAKEVRISAELTSYRIKQLQKRGIIQGYRAMIDVERLGYHFYKAEIRLSNYKKIKQIMQFCHQHPNIYQVDKTIGGETLEIEFHVKKLQGMLDIIAEIEGIFQNTIESFDYITVLSEEKMVYMPKISVPLSK
jgi:DNA-binding Lrp family transcriptional regulator